MNLMTSNTVLLQTVGIARRFAMVVSAPYAYYSEDVT